VVCFKTHHLSLSEAVQLAELLPLQGLGVDYSPKVVAGVYSSCMAHGFGANLEAANRWTFL